MEGICHQKMWPGAQKKDDTKIYFSDKGDPQVFHCVYNLWHPRFEEVMV